LVGHSMGGAIAVHAAALGGIPSLAGIVVIDVVEGTAMASLPYMSTVLQKRPKQFASLRHAVDWALDSGVCKRQEAAHVSLPSMLRQEAAGGGWVWRTQLERSAPFWEGWYAGLSDMFLKLPVPKVLVLVGTDRLDRPLTIGQMQGKFQPVLLPQAGHAVHEDEPERTADAIATFIKRFRIGEPPLQIPRPAPGIRPAL
ncbi:hypothetical protein CHLNCDRAFT_9699, partial [Chlorella variabilis]